MGGSYFSNLLAVLGLTNTFYPCVWLGIGVLGAYFGNERSFLHRPKVERVFWFFMYGWVAFVLLVLPDSPIHRLRLAISFGDANSIALVLLAGLFGFRTHSAGMSSRLQSKIQRLDLKELAKLQPETIEARIATARISEALMPKSKIKRIFRSNRTEKALVNEVLQEVCDSGPEQLLYILNAGEIDLPQLFYTAGSPELYELLVSQISFMDVVTKARLIDALQRQPDFFISRTQQEMVVEMFLQTTSRELSTLKSLLDEGGDFYNLHKLVFSDLPSDLNEMALTHIETEGKKVRLHCSDRLVKVLSDIDDTLYCSGGMFPAGADKRFAKHQIYPGVLALFRELSRPQPGGVTKSKRRSSSSNLDEDELMVKKTLTSKISARLFEDFGRIRATTSEKTESDHSVWFRVGETEWKEVFLSGEETLSQLKDRLEEYRAEQMNASTEAGPADISLIPPTRRVMSNLVFLSARPHAYKDYLESKSYKLFQNLRGRGMVHCMPTLLAGRIGSSTEAALRGAVLQFRGALGGALLAFILATVGAKQQVLHIQTIAGLLMFVIYIRFTITTRRLYHNETSVWQPVGADKRRSFLEYRRLYCECDMVFFGDNGQGDLVCAEELMKEVEGTEDDEEAGNVVSFIHEVIPRTAQLQVTDCKDNASWEEKGIYFFQTYIGAAVKAFKVNLITEEGLARVARCAVEDLVRIGTTAAFCTDPKKRKKGKVQELPIREMNQDVEAVNKLLPEGFPRVGKVPEALLAEHLSEPVMGKSKSMKTFNFSTPGPLPDDHH